MKFLKIFFLLFIYNLNASSCFKKILKVPANYFINLKKDIQKIKLEKSSIKNFVSLHPFVSAKVVHEGLGILYYVFIPSLRGQPSNNFESQKKNFKYKEKIIKHLFQKSKFYFFSCYLHLFYFNDQSNNKNNFFSFEENNWLDFAIFPILTSLASMRNIVNDIRGIYL